MSGDKSTQTGACSAAVPVRSTSPFPEPELESTTPSTSAAGTVENLMFQFPRSSPSQNNKPHHYPDPQCTPASAATTIRPSTSASASSSPQELPDLQHQSHLATKRAESQERHKRVSQRRSKKQAQSLQCVCACGGGSSESLSPPGRYGGSAGAAGDGDGDAVGVGEGEVGEGDKECYCPTQKSSPCSSTVTSTSDDALLATSRLLQIEALEQQLQIQRDAAATWQTEASHHRNMNAAW